jgi:hypothetical protein
MKAKKHLAAGATVKEEHSWESLSGWRACWHEELTVYFHPI